MATDGDPTAIRSLAITVEDVVAALELNRTTARRAVLRVTPPFSGRMRARLHVVDNGNGDDDGALHVDPDTLVADPPAYPTAVDTEEELRGDPTATYSVERHHDYHLDAVADWREAVTDAIRDRATVQSSAGSHEVGITTLGDLPDENSQRRGKNSE